jgi:hypothetical protein
MCRTKERMRRTQTLYVIFIPIIHGFLLYALLCFRLVACELGPASTLETTSCNKVVTKLDQVKSVESKLEHCGPVPDPEISWDRSRGVEMIGLESVLGPSSDGVRQKHSHLIEGLNQLYDLLIQMDYISREDVQQPPHAAPKPALEVARLRSLGFTIEVIALMQQLP